MTPVKPTAPGRSVMTPVKLTAPGRSVMTPVKLTALWGARRSKGMALAGLGRHEGGLRVEVQVWSESVDLKVETDC